MSIETVVNGVNSVLRDYILVIILFAIGIYYTISTKGVQFRKMRYALSNIFKKSDTKEGEVSSFQALAVSVAAQLGTGSIAGIAVAITVGGPGAIFWMWLMSIFGMATIFAEAVLAQKFREKDSEGHYIGGPAYYLKNGLKNKKFGKVLSIIFAVLIIIALGFFGIMTQSNSIASSVNEAFPKIPLWIIGVVVAILAGAVFIGGIDRISKFAELVVPFMAILYVIFSIIILFKFSYNIIPAFKLIFKGAFTPISVLGAGAGYGVQKAISMGFSKGLFTNEAGLGSTPHAHAAADSKNPVEQGYMAMTGVFFCSLIICTASALIILTTETRQMQGLSGALVTQKAFELSFGNFGKIMLAISLTFFAFTTIVGWYYYGETNILYLFGEKGLPFYRIIVLIFIVLGSLQAIDLVWNFSDLFNALMVIPNIIGLFLLKDVVVSEMKKYEK